MKNFKSNEPCLICENHNACYHHIKTKKSRPDLKFDERNLMPLCQQHHNEIHNKGTNTFVNKYNLSWWLYSKGWIFDAHINKWVLTS